MGSVRLAPLLLILVGASYAFAQEYPVPPPPPPPQWQYAPPYSPPPPPYLPPLPTRGEIDALERSARHKILGGDVLIGTGSALALAGTGLAIASAFVDDGSCVSYYGPYGHHGYYYASCGNAALAYAGATTLFFGIAALVPGTYLRADGARDLATAHALRRASRYQWSVIPKLSPQAALGEASLRF